MMTSKLNLWVWAVSSIMSTASSICRHCKFSLMIHIYVTWFTCYLVVSTDLFNEVDTPERSLYSPKYAILHVNRTWMKVWFCRFIKLWPEGFSLTFPCWTGFRQENKNILAYYTNYRISSACNTMISNPEKTGNLPGTYFFLTWFHIDLDEFSAWPDGLDQGPATQSTERDIFFKTGKKKSVSS